MAQLSEWVSVSEAVRLSGLSTRTLKRMADEGRIKFSRSPGGHIRIGRAQLDGLLRPSVNSPKASASSVLQNRREHIEELSLEAQALRAKRELENLRAEDADRERERAEARRSDAAAHELALEQVRAERRREAQQRERERLARQVAEKRARLIEQIVSQVLPSYTTDLEKAKALSDARGAIASIPDSAAEWEFRAMLLNALGEHRKAIEQRNVEERTAFLKSLVQIAVRLSGRG